MNLVRIKEIDEPGFQVEQLGGVCACVAQQFHVEPDVTVSISCEPRRIDIEAFEVESVACN